MPAADRKAQTLYDKIFQAHVVDEKSDGTILLYIGVFWSWCWSEYTHLLTACPN